MARKYQKFTPEFRDQAAKLVVDAQRPIAEVAREYGLGETTLVGVSLPGRRAGGKMGAGCPPTPLFAWDVSPRVSLAPGP